MAIKELWNFTSVPKPSGTLPVVLCRRPDGSFQWLTVGELLNDIVSANGYIPGQSFYIEKAADSTIVLSGYSATTSLGSVSTSANGNGLAILTGNQLNTALGLATCTATSNVIIAVNGQALVTTLGSVAVSASGSASVSPSGISAAILLGQVTAASGASGTGMPSGIGATMTLGAAVASGIRNVTTPVVGISASAALGAVTAIGSSGAINATAYPSGALLNITLGSGITALATRNIVLTLTGLSCSTGLGAVTASAGGASNVLPPFTFETATGGTYVADSISAVGTTTITAISGISTDYAHAGTKSLKLRSPFSGYVEAYYDEDLETDVVIWHMQAEGYAQWVSPSFNTGANTSVGFWLKSPNADGFIYANYTGGPGFQFSIAPADGWKQYTMSVPTGTDIQLQFSAKKFSEGYTLTDSASPPSDYPVYYIDDITLG